MITKLLLAGLCVGGPNLKVKIDGDGYMRFIRDWRAVYSKQASLQIEDGKLTDSAGDTLLPSISVSATARKIEIDLNGNIFATYGGERTKAGQIILAQFPKT